MTSSEGRRERAVPVLQALAGKPRGMSTTEVAEACFTDGVTNPHVRAFRALRRLAGSGKAEVAGDAPVPGAGGIRVFTWKITDAGRAWLAERTTSRGRVPA